LQQQSLFFDTKDNRTKANRSTARDGEGILISDSDDLVIDAGTLKTFLGKVMMLVGKAKP
jgi:hypothetical protein